MSVDLVVWHALISLHTFWKWLSLYERLVALYSWVAGKQSVLERVFRALLWRASLRGAAKCALPRI
jgi:hypothetical protein